MTEPKRLAGIAGALYLLMFVLGGIAHLGVRADIRVPGDAAATALNIAANPTLFRLSLVADIAMATIFVRRGRAVPAAAPRRPARRRALVV